MDLSQKETSGGRGVPFDPLPSLCREMRGHASRCERTSLSLLGHLLGISRLAADVRCDPGQLSVDAVRPGPVSDEEVQAAMRRDQDRLAGDDQVAREGERHDRAADAGEARADGGPNAVQRRGRPRNRRDAQECIWTVEREEAERRAGREPTTPASRRTPAETRQPFLLYSPSKKYDLERGHPPTGTGPTR